MKKRIKRKAVGRAPQTRQVESPVVPVETTKPLESSEMSGERTKPIEEVVIGDKPLWKAEYVFQQYYEITIDESLLEENAFQDYGDSDRASLREEYLTRFKRMLKSLVTNSKALHAVCEFLVYRELEDGDSYCREHYGDYNKSLADILEEHIDCFALEDREILSSRYTFETLAEALREAIQLEPSGFRVGQHACKLVKDDKEK